MATLDQTTMLVLRFNVWDDIQQWVIPKKDLSEVRSMYLKDSKLIATIHLPRKLFLERVKITFAPCAGFIISEKHETSQRKYLIFRNTALKPEHAEELLKKLNMTNEWRRLLVPSQRSHLVFHL